MDLFASINAFVAVVDDGAFVKAARRLGVATSSVSRQVDSLEAHLKATLLNRSTRSITLTETGQLYYDNAVRILQDLSEANDGAADILEAPHGLLRVSLPVVFAQMYIAPFFKEFLDRYPEIELDVNLTDNVVNLVEDRTDLAVRIGSVEPTTLITRRLCSSRRALCASAGYLAASGTPALPSELRSHNCLTFSYSRSSTPWKFSKGGETETVRVRGSMRANNSAILLEAVLSGCGIGLLPYWLIQQELAKGSVKPVLQDWEVTPSTPGEIYAVYLANRRHSSKVRAFIDFFAARLRSLDEGGWHLPSNGIEAR